MLSSVMSHELGSVKSQMISEGREFVLPISSM